MAVPWLSAPVGDHSAFFFQESYLTIILQICVHPGTVNHGIPSTRHQELPFTYCPADLLGNSGTPLSPLQEEILESNLPHPGMLAWKQAEEPGLLLSSLKGSFLKLLLFPKLPDFGRAPFSISHCIRFQI